MITAISCLPTWSAAGTVVEAELFTHLDAPLAVALPERSAFADRDPVASHNPVSVLPPTSPPTALVHIDTGKLLSAREALDQGRPAVFTLNMGDNVVHRAVFETTTATRGGYTLSGRLDAGTSGMVTLAIRGAIVAGRVQAADRIWSVESHGPGVHAIRPVRSSVTCANELSSVPASDSEGPEALRAPRSSAIGGGARDDGSEIDVLVLFTTEARRRYGYKRIRADIDLTVAATNQAYAVGQAVQRLRLVAAVETSYRESAQLNQTQNARDDLHRLATPGDGHLDEAHRLRDLYAADIVYLVRSGPFGVARLLNPRNDAAAEAANGFAVGQAGPQMASFFAHELGHVMGLFHERWGGVDDRLLPYAYGYVNELGLRDGEPDERRWYTIMAYGTQCRTLGYQCHQLMRFSNPNQLHPDDDGDPMGVPGEDPTHALDGPADAIRNMNETRRLVANFKPSSARCGYALDSDALDVGPEGGHFAVDVATDGRCEWDARSMDGFATPTVAAGRGTDRIGIDVAPNDGFARLGFVTIAGETVTIRQRGDVSPTSVCDRSTHVRKALVAATGRESCAEVTEFDLLEVRELDLSGVDGGLEFGLDDLQGLRSLVGLRAVSSGIRELPAGLFEGLESLHELSIAHNLIGAIPAHVFRGLDALHNLNLDHNQIRRLQVGSFRGLSGLAALTLRGNAGVELDPFVFMPLSSLWYLGIDDAALGTLDDARVFSGLGNLLRLDMCRSGLTHLADGIFAELGNLEWLVLCDNRLTSIRRQTFSGLERISYLGLWGNPITDLPEDVFAEIPSLGHLWMWSTPLRALPPGVFDGTAPVSIRLAGSRIADVTGVRFPGERIAELDLSDSDLRSLPPAMFSGFKSEACYIGELTLELDGNPGAPFSLAPRLRRIDAGVAATGPASVVLELPTGAPVVIEWAVEAVGEDGEPRLLTQATIQNGDLRSKPFEVDELGYVRLRAATLPGRELPVTVQGVTIREGAVLGLFGFEDRDLILGDDAHLVDLAHAFAEDGSDGANLSFSVTSSDDDIATVSLSDGRLAIHPAGVGTATVTITVVGPGGTALSRTLVVTVHAPEFDHGGTAGAATLLPIGPPLPGTIGDADDVDVFRIDLQGRASLEVRTTGPTDVRGELLDGTGARLASDDDSGPGGRNFLVREDLEAGIYYVAVRGDPGDYAVMARLGDAPDHGGTAATATLLTLYAEADLDRVSPSALLATPGRIAPTDADVDIFRLDVPRNGTAVTVRSAGATDVVGRLLDASRDEIAADASEGNFRIEARLDAGTHYVEVGGRETGTYRVLAWAAPASCPCAAAPSSDHGGDAEHSTLMPIGPPVPGTISDTSDVDVFRIDLQGSATLEVRTSGPTDVRGELLDGAGATLASDDGSGPAGHNFLVRENLEAGIYYVAVRGDPGDYAVMARLGDAPDHGGTEATATLLTLYAEKDLDRVSPNALLAAPGKIAPTGADVDVFRLDVPANATDVTVRSSGSTDVHARLLDSSMNEIAADTSDGNFRIKARLDRGAYYVAVGGRETGTYRILAWAGATACDCEATMAPRVSGAPVRVFERIDRAMLSFMTARGNGAGDREAGRAAIRARLRVARPGTVETTPARRAVPPR